MQQLASSAETLRRHVQAFGLIWGGPSNHYWQKFLEKFFKGKRDGATLVQKVSVPVHPPATRCPEERAAASIGAAFAALQVGNFQLVGIL